jgi:hypothetical protein
VIKCGLGVTYPLTSAQDHSSFEVEEINQRELSTYEINFSHSWPTIVVDHRNIARVFYHAFPRQPEKGND